MKQCGKCGQEIVEGAAFCANCGMPVNSSASTTELPAGLSMPVMTPPASSSASVMASAEEPKKKTDGKIIIMATVGVIGFVVGIIGISLAVAGGNKGQNDSQIVANNSNNSSGTIDVVPSSTKVLYAGYEFVVPNGYDYEVTDSYGGEEALATSSNVDEYMAVTFYDESATFAQVEDNMSDLADYLSEGNDGATATSSVETVDGVKFLCFDFGDMEEAGMMYAISEADLYYFQTVILTKPGASGKQYLGDVAKIVKSAQKKSDAKKAFDGAATDNVSMPKLRVSDL